MMTLHYHGTPLTPLTALYELAGRNFCVSHSDPRDAARAHQIGQSVMLDNGAFSKWKRKAETDWPSYYAWAEEWLSCPTTWAVIPDEIDGGAQIQDALVREWPFGPRGAPVWHMDEPLDRLLRLVDHWPKVCIGSTGEFRDLRWPAWERRMDEIWNRVMESRRFTPWIHMLRGMGVVGKRWPFGSVDSTDVAQSHHRPQNTPALLAQRWDKTQSPIRWARRPEQLELA